MIQSYQYLGEPTPGVDSRPLVVLLVSPYKHTCTQPSTNHGTHTFYEKILKKGKKDPGLERI
jgi:hypothetical protein